MRETTVALGFPEEALQGEVLHFLDRLPGTKVVGASGNTPALRRLVRDRRPDAIVAIPHLLRGLDHVAKLAVTVRESTEALRAAIQAGARGFFVWPHERDALARELQRLQPIVRGRPAHPGVVASVIAARGGAGATFLATNLAGALARRGVETVLVDLDLTYGDVTPALGIAADVSLPSVVDLASVSGELTSEHVERVVHRHPAGFHVLPAPPLVSAKLPETAIRAMVRGLQAGFAAVLLHLPRTIDEATTSALEVSDAVLLVVTPDVVGVRAAKRLTDHLRAVGVGDSLGVVINRCGRSEVIPEDVRDALELPVAAVIGADRTVQRAQNRGELVVGGRGRVPRRLDRLAATVLQGVAA